MKFDEYFSEPKYFSDESYVVSGGYTREEAASLIGKEAGVEVAPGQLKENRVRFGFPPDDVEDREKYDPVWYTGAAGRGSKLVWVLQPS